jgi:CBS domain containing-hemolysin-like protein
MAQPDQRGPWSRALRVGLLAFCLAVVVNWASDLLLESVPAVLAILVVVLLIVSGVAFDILGTAVTAANAAPLHAMAARKIPGARQAIWLTRNADAVANFCNDVVGDVTGAVTGVAGGTLALRLSAVLHAGNLLDEMIGLVVIGLIAFLVVGGKAAGKSIAIQRATDVLILAGRAIWAFEQATRRSWTQPGNRASRRRST